MRTLLAMTILMLSAFCAQAQDDAATQAAQQAAQQAGQQAQQQMQQLQQQTQQMSDQMTRQTMQNLEDASNSTNNATWCCGLAAKPTFSVKPGTYSGTTTVKIRDATRGAVIYYTTDGWTPTTASKRYTGPITIDTTTTLNAIAFLPGPYLRRSMVGSAQYTIAGTQPGPPKASTPELIAPSIVAGSAILRQGTPVHLVFAMYVNSKTADVGDKIQLTLAEDIKAGDTVLVAKGAPAVATITEVDKTGAGGAPGNIVFQVNSLDANGNTVKLSGSETKGASRSHRTRPCWFLTWAFSPCSGMAKTRRSSQEHL
jgi:chitobiase/beta-hexosaminidase-like protein